MRSIGRAATSSGVPVETIRYYERTGVVPRPPRSASGRRLYDADAIARLRFVRRCRDLGFPLADVRVLLALSGEADPCASVRQCGEGHLATVRAKIADLRRLEVALEQLLEPCATPESSCPALQALFAGDLGQVAGSL